MEERRFEIMINGIEEIFKQFTEPRKKVFDEKGNVFSLYLDEGKYELIKVGLAYPIKEIIVQGGSDKKTYHLGATIVAQNKFLSSSTVKKIELAIPQKKLSQNFNLSMEGKTVFILNDEEEDEFEISVEESHSTLIEITAGPQFKTMDGFSTPPKIISDLETFKRDFRKFIKIIEVVLQGIYEKHKQEAPRTTLYIKPSSPIAKKNVFRENNLPTITKEKPICKFDEKWEKVYFEDIGGQKEGKKEIQTISFALKNPGLYKKWGTTPPKGVLLFGPPGTGKTLMARALATEAKAHFYIVKVAEMTSKWYGESEKKMQSVFDLAKTNSPSIIFFDEIDAIASERDDSQEATRRVIGTLLQNLDGIEPMENIIVVASTNRLEAVDSAIKRPGRIDRLVEVPLPDKEGREHIIKICFARAEKMARRKLFKKNVDIHRIVSLTSGMSGADLTEIVRRALEEKVREAGNGKNPTLVSTENILQEIEGFKKSRKIKQTIGFSDQN